MQNLKNLKTVYLDEFINWLIQFGPKLVLALVILVVGFWLTKLIIRTTKKLLVRYQVEPTLASFSINLLNVSLKFLVVLATVMKLGIVKESMIVSAIAAMAFAVGMALQGSLGNFAGGIIVMVFKPYKVGDLIESQGIFGEVQEIQIFNTVLLTPSGKTAFIPNGALSNGNIINYTTRGKFRVELSIGISYNANIKEAKEIILKVMHNNSNILKDPAPAVSVKELADSSVNLSIRPWTTPKKYWDVYFDTLEECKNALDKAGIEIPFPQRDVHLFEHKA
ncbi:MAG TPA: mechanosensitive ion channel [Flavobacteriia bacterium]|nr:mechanosensitive ion channel [Flavobacteriia bacterium]